MSEGSNNSLEYQHRMEVWKQTVARKTAIFSALTAAVVDFASLAIKSIILGNGAAAAAVLAFLGAVWGTKEAAAASGSALFAVKIFAGGVFAAMIAAGASYFAQYCYAQAEISEDGSTRQRYFTLGAYPFHVVGIVAAIAGIASFAWGSWEGIQALAAANGGLAPK